MYPAVPKAPSAGIEVAGMQRYFSPYEIMLESAFHFVSTKLKDFQLQHS